MRDRRDYRDRHVDRPRGSTWHPKPDSSSRRFRPRSTSPSVRRHRRDYIERHPGPVHRNPVHQDHLPVHHHSVTVRDRPYDLPPLNHLLPEYPSDMNQEMKHKPLLTHKDAFLDDGLGGENDLLLHRGTHMLDEGDRRTGRERERSLYPRERENPLSLAKPNARNEREREKSLFAREREPPLSDTMLTSLAERDREKSLYPRETQNPLSDPMLTSSRVERERSLYPRERETPLSVTLQPSLSLTERDRERTQYNRRDPPVSNTIPPFPTERERERNNHDTIKLQTSLEERDRERNNYTIPPFRTERDRERTHFPTRERDRDRDRERSTIPSSHLRPINGGPSSFYRDHLYEKEEDDLMNRRDRYNNLTSNEPLKKVPLYYPNHDYDDGYTARSSRVFVDPVHSNYSPRHPLYHMVHPFHMHDHHDDVPYNLHHRATYRDRSESPIFHDNNRGKGIHGPVFHDNRHHHVHHMHDLYDDNHDSDIDGDHYGYIPKRIPVKERIVERERGERMRRPNFSSKKPMFPRAKYNNDEIYHVKNIKKRPLDRNDGGYNNYKPPHKYQKRAFLEEQNENEDKNEDENENFDDDSKNEEERENENDEGIVLKRDPPEGSEEFKREVEKAFINFAKKINGTSREKNKFLQSRREGLSCYVCASESKTFAETHNLVVHSYHTKKPGLRTAHLGLQKALCLLMGWNWLIVPDESRTYQMAPPGEAKLLKQDRLVWPPIVVIRNSSILSRVSKPSIVIVSEIEDMLKGIIGEGKGKVCYGKPANQSVFLVKFDPTLSGYETAKLIHNHFTNKNKGKDHFDNFIQNRDRTTKEKVQGGDGSDKEDVLFGYMAGIEDLDKLDCPKVHIKSKREIEAIVEAT